MQLEPRKAQREQLTGAYLQVCAMLAMRSYVAREFKEV